MRRADPHTLPKVLGYFDRADTGTPVVALTSDGTPDMSLRYMGNPALLLTLPRGKDPSETVLMCETFCNHHATERRPGIKR